MVALDSSKTNFFDNYFFSEEIKGAAAKVIIA